VDDEDRVAARWRRGCFHWQRRNVLTHLEVNQKVSPLLGNVDDIELSSKDTGEDIAMEGAP
jgi:hypothetical protein